MTIQSLFNGHRCYIDGNGFHFWDVDGIDYNQLSQRNVVAVVGERKN